MKTFAFLLAIVAAALTGAVVLFAVPPGPIPTRLANGEVQIQAATAAGSFHRLETSPDLLTWTPLVTLLSPGTLTHIDSAAPYHPQQRFYRVQPLAGTGHLTGDHIATSAGEVVVHPVNHASFVMRWNGKMIYNDPVGNAAVYTGLAKADLILVSHGHGDHYSSTTLSTQLAPGGVIIAPPTVKTGMPMALQIVTTALANGQTTTALGLTIEAVPAYNGNHPRGTGQSGNGYVVTIGGQRFYMAGDTGDTLEMRALPNIDVAFLCMNSFTMTVAQAASAARAFRPRIVFPYHFSSSDLASFKQQVGTDLGIEVRVRTWY